MKKTPTPADPPGPLNEGIAVGLKIRRAQPSDLEALVALFEGYRIFYKQAGDAGKAETFLRDRLDRQDSVLLVASEHGPSLVGFTQLYPSFSSVSMRRIFILNDLFVAPGARKAGVARALMQAAEDHARSVGAIRLSLATAVDNLPAQTLYESLGYVRDEVFHHYHLTVTPDT